MSQGPALELLRFVAALPAKTSKRSTPIPATLHEAFGEMRRHGYHALAPMLVPLCISWLALAQPQDTVPPGIEVARHEFVWEAPLECPTGAKMRARVEGLLGHPIDPPLAEPIQIEARVAPDPNGSGLVLDMSIESASGIQQRLFRAATCRELADAAAVVIAVAIDPSATLQTVDPEPTPSPAVSATPTPAAQPAKEPQDPQPPKSVKVPPAPETAPWGGFVDVFAGIGLGQLPSANFISGLQVGVRGPSLRLLVRGGFWFPREARLPGSDAYARISLFWLEPRGCGVPRWRWLEIPLCAGVAIGALEAEPYEVTEGARKRMFWGAATLSAGLLFVPTRHFAIGLEPDLLVPFVLPGFEFEDLGLVHRASRVGFAAFISLEARFP